MTGVDGFLMRIGVLEREVDDLKRQLSSKEAHIRLLNELADQRNALIDDLIRKLPVEQREIV